MAATSNAVVERAATAVAPAPAPAPASETAAILSVIERAARDPSVDIDKMQRLMDMRDRELTRNAKAAYMAALAEMQPELPSIAERGEIRHDRKDRSAAPQSTYARWEDINDAIKPALAKHGFALSFRTGRDGDRIVVTGILGHREGHSEETTMHLPADSSGSKNAVQAVGSSTSYGKRYTAMALLNLTSRAPEDRDDDGRAGGGGSTISEEQIGQMRDLIEKVEADLVKFCNHLGIPSLADLPAARFDGAMRELRDYGEKRRREMQERQRQEGQR